MSSPSRLRALVAVGLVGLAAFAVATLGSQVFLDDGPLEIDGVARTRFADVELLEARLSRGAGEDGGRMFLLYFDPQRVRPRLLLNTGEAPLGDLAPWALAVANAGFFTPERRATGLLVSEGRVLSPFVREGGGAGSGVFMVEEGRPRLVPRSELTRRSFDGVELAIQAGPRVIEPGGAPGIRTDDGQRANRTLVGRDGLGRMVVAVVLGPSGWSSGPTLYEVQRLLGAEGVGRTAKALALDQALNLDGGPSTGLYLRGGPKPLGLAESAPVYSVLTLERAR